MQRTTRGKELSDQVKRRVTSEKEEESAFKGNTETMISTGSTLLDLAISGSRVRGGGLPTGILVEIFGPSGTGKTVLLCEIAGAIQRIGGDIMFHDPEARLNETFAKIFDLNPEEMDYSTPNTIPELFNKVRKWDPNPDNVNGILADSLAALSTELEMSNDEGDRMGMRRSKEFSEELRRTARILKKNNYLMVCSNQVRVNIDSGPYGQKYTAPGGLAFEFYSSLRLRMKGSIKLKKKETIAGKEVTRIIGITTEIEVAKSSVDKPLRSAPVTIIFDYGIDDIRENLIFIKKYTGEKVYTVKDEKLSNSIEKSIQMVEENNWEGKLKQQVILLWEEIESKFASDRKQKQR